MSVKATDRFAMILCASIHCADVGRSPPFALIVSVNLLLPKPERIRGLPQSISKSVVCPLTIRGRRSAPQSLPGLRSSPSRCIVAVVRSANMNRTRSSLSLRHTSPTAIQASTDSVSNAAISPIEQEISPYRNPLRLQGPSNSVGDSTWLHHLPRTRAFSQRVGLLVSPPLPQSHTTVRRVDPSHVMAGEREEPPTPAICSSNAGKLRHVCAAQVSYITSSLQRPSSIPRTALCYSPMCCSSTGWVRGPPS